MKRLADCIMVVDGVVSKEMASEMIDKFEAVNIGDEKRVSQMEWDKDYRQFTELNLTAHKDFVDIHNALIDRQCEVYNEYRKRAAGDFLLPIEGCGFEGIRMKKYAPNDYDQFGWHADVGDVRSARRSLAMFTYLNDVEEGGETLFDVGLPDGKFLTIIPKCGRMVIFPPMWMFPHKGNKPVSGPKYIVSQYTHYL